MLAKLVQKARLGGIHDTLAYMNEMMDCDDWEPVFLEDEDIEKQIEIAKAVPINNPDWRIYTAM